MTAQCNAENHAAIIESPTNSIAGLIPFDDWLKALGKDRSTGYRYRKRGDVTTVNIYGRLYITPEEITRFAARAAAGEFARKVRSPFSA